jgi:hypothetical protein
MIFETGVGHQRPSMMNHVHDGNKDNKSTTLIKYS